MALLEAKRFASRRLLHVLGPTATQLCLRIELAATIADVIVAVRRSCTVVRDVRGTTHATLFGDAEYPGREAIPAGADWPTVMATDRFRAALGRIACTYDGGHIME